MMSDLRWRQIVISFLLGIVLTAGLCHFCIGPWSRPSDPKARYEHMLSRFSRRLDLTDDQKPKVAKIFETQREKIDAVRDSVRPRFNEIRAAASAEIRQLLTPEQQAKFDTMEAKDAEMKKRWREKGRRRPPR